MIRRILLVVALVGGMAALNVHSAEAGCPTRNVSVNDVTVGEGDGTADFSVTLDDAPGCDTTVDFATQNGTAEAGTDYEATSGTLTFSAELNETQKTVSVPITDDDEVEDDETFTLNLSNPNSFAVIADGEGVGTIQDNDEAPTTTTSTSTTTTTAPPTSTISDDNPNPGDDVDITASGFKGGSDTQIFFLSEPILLTTATADSGGVVRATVTIPEDAQPGAHTIEVRGVDSSDTPRTVSIPITVAGEATDTTAPAQPLAATGSGLSTLILVAGVLAAAGGALLFQVRRRRTAGTA